MLGLVRGGTGAPSGKRACFPHYCCSTSSSLRYSSWHKRDSARTQTCVSKIAPPRPHPSDGFQTDSCLFGLFIYLPVLSDLFSGDLILSTSSWRFFSLFGRCNPKWFSTAFLMTINGLRGTTRPIAHFFGRCFIASEYPRRC